MSSNLLRVVQEQQETIEKQSRLIADLIATLESWEQTAGYDGVELKERKNVNIKIDIFSCFYRFAILHNTQPVLLYIFTFRQRSSKAATAASLSRSLYPLLCKLLYLFLE